MITSTFYNDNRFRSYPFVTPAAASPFPNKRIVAAKVTCSYASPYASFPTVLMTGWEVRSREHRLTFTCSDGIEQAVLTVLIPKDAGLFTHHRSDEQRDTRIRVTIGDLSDATESFVGLNPPLRLEPVCLLWLKHRGVRSIRLGNANRPRLPAAIYPGISFERKDAWERTRWWLQERSIQNEPLLFSEGCNCSLTVSTLGNRILFTPQLNAGLGPVRELVSLGGSEAFGSLLDEFPDPLPEHVRPDGLPYPDRMLASFCGATGPEITWIPNETVGVRNDLDASTVSIHLVGLHGKGC